MPAPQHLRSQQHSFKWERLGARLMLKLTGLLALLVGLSFVTFALTHLAPGDAALNTLQPMGVTSHEVISALRQHLGLDAPLIVQYLTWLTNLVTAGDLGLSSHFGREVSTVLSEGLAVSLPLFALAFIFLIVITLPLGTYCALRPNSLIDPVFSPTLGRLLPTPSAYRDRPRAHRALFDRLNRPWHQLNAPADAPRAAPCHRQSAPLTEPEHGPLTVRYGRD